MKGCVSFGVVYPEIRSCLCHCHCCEEYSCRRGKKGKEVEQTYTLYAIEAYTKGKTDSRFYVEGKSLSTKKDLQDI
jgi:hypothetical protein